MASAAWVGVPYIRAKLVDKMYRPSQKVRRDVSRHFRNKNEAYLKAKIEELETNSKINNVRDLYRGI
jgi:BMFP domain-containing protein YqiC